MITSMTGCGESAVKTPRFSASVHLNSVNNRFLDLKFNTGRMLSVYENEFSEILRAHIRRGKVEIFVSVTFNTSAHKLKIDDGLLSAFLKETRRAAKAYKIRSEPSFTDILSVKGILIQTDYQFMEKDIAALKKVFEAAAGKLTEMRRSEGKNLEADLKKNLGEIEKNVDRIRKDRTRLEEQYKTRLLEKANAFRKDFQLDNNRLMTEIAIMLSKSDISEELTRLDSHIRQFTAFFNETDPVGRRLDFLSQELLREVNTIGSKISDEKITGAVIRIKDHLEKIREQVQNIE
jgi:uncharacterized protein (TIGR00255 family)